MSTINLTRHAIVVFDDNGNVLKTYPPSGHEARVEQKPQTTYDPVDGVPVVGAPVFTDKIIIVPPLELDGSVGRVLVSMLVGQVVQRTQKNSIPLSVAVLGPDTGPSAVVRDGQGKMIGVKRLVYYFRSMQ